MYIISLSPAGEDHAKAEAPVSSAVYSDVGSDHWAAEEIQWARDNGIMTGYEDGRFGPRDEMSEAQFAVMLDRAFDLETAEREDGQFWALPSYRALSYNNLRLQGLRDNVIASQPVTRGVVSQTLAHIQGQDSELEESVAWMFEHELTTGRQEGETETERFDVNGKLTRDQAASFFKRLHDQGFTSWEANGLLDLTPEGSNEYTEIVRSLYREAGVTLYARDDRSFATANEEYYHLFQAYEGERREYVISRTSESNFQLAADAAEALGIPASSEEIYQALSDANATGEEQSFNNIDIIPRPSDIFMLWDAPE
ncbi:S-layer homology domain-containing protein [Alteribacillus sp. HJP-4]